MCERAKLSATLEIDIDPLMTSFLSFEYISELCIIHLSAIRKILLLAVSRLTPRPLVIRPRRFFMVREKIRPRNASCFVPPDASRDLNENANNCKYKADMDGTEECVDDK